MNILEVIPFFSPIMGGSPRIVHHLSENLSAIGQSVTVLAGDYQIEKASFPAGDYQTTLLSSVFSRWGFYITPGIVGWCQKYIREYDIVHLHEVRTFQNIIVSRYAKKNKIPYILSAHGTLPVIIERIFAKRIFDILFGHRILDSAERLIAVSPWEENQFIQFGIDKSRSRTILNGLRLAEFVNPPPMHQFREKWGITDDTKIILFLGRLHKIKGIDSLVEAFSILQAQTGKSVLVIAGPDFGEQNNLRALVNRKGLLGKVKLVGSLYGQDKIAAYCDADVLVYPAIYEIFGLVPFEALMGGTPVIVADDCGAGQLIREAGAGYTFRAGDVDELAKTIGYVLENPKKAQARVEAGQRFIRENLDWEKNTGKLVEVYEECIRSNAYRRKI